MSDDRHAKLSRRAYELWEQEGGEHGRDQDHWHRADRELGGETPAADVSATADEVSGLTPHGEIVAPDGTTMAEDAATATEVNAPRKRTSKPRADTPTPNKPRKPKAK